MSSNTKTIKAFVRIKPDITEDLIPSDCPCYQFIEFEDGQQLECLVGIANEWDMKADQLIISYISHDYFITPVITPYQES